ncbi:energy-coupling factor transporter ATPase [Lacicoccus alkaliphilus]|uniref:Energy-coupling factor transporter ATP-binding protein EcfA2 n=1 Tax=Lacicoccus alkaliphilus DSM 16010 TaxID=1123231 RepID=A0A1M7EFX5_9BACL|nr:energy-coupling factor transporter ATPase [Salinicoccus alkaliphilus]SHL90249.1 energy-coupling factor transport system ATP-binding protein [Salinicoccus alkaliphilus DSM 16010]
MNITVDGLTSIYHAGTPFEHIALDHLTTTFEPGKYYAIIGRTGSGKSTLIQHLNGLILPTEGEVQVGDLTLGKKTKQRIIHQVKKHVGMVFQFPEHQLFDETILKDVMFGPLNMGFTEAEAQARAEKYLSLLGVPERAFGRSPFDLSGGQMRKIAIAGILAMEPEVLIVDEPTAGLDPKSHIEVMELFKRIQQEFDITIILVTHDMNDVFEYADEVKLLAAGGLIREGPTEDILTDELLLTDHHLEIPDIVKLTHDLERKGIVFETVPRNTEAFITLYREWRDARAQ